MTSANPLALFDRRAVRRFRARAARGWGAADFLVNEVAERLADRLDDVKRRFPVALDLGCRDGVLARVLRGRGGIETLVPMDAAFAFRPAVVAEAEALPFKPASFDLILSVLDLHHVNDLPGALLQLRQALKPDGLLLAALFAGDTLTELRRAWMEAELAEQGGAGSRVSPFADPRDLGALLQRAGFALPVIDSDPIEATYDNALKLMRDLRAMGEANPTSERSRTFTRRATLARALEFYGAESGRIGARFEIATLTAWAPLKSR
ncbi:MAG TPA: methyltransferase domain-containing protein [Stellaceae bacterium]|jgi:SAM-dependent methyltransferase|nr:methyltransferase domain-containing protein [Stellaceae bacterium]